MIRKMNVAIIGLGPRAETLLASFSQIEDIEVFAVCDLSQERINLITDILVRNGKSTPKTFLNYHELLKYEEIEAVFVTTAWNSHLTIATDCMNAGKYVAIEVGGAASLEELWQLVHASERSGKPCMMLENCCYARNELMVLNMVRQGLFGELVYCEGGYEHCLLDDHFGTLESCYRERNYHNLRRNGELYPTHELGPIAKILRINRGNRFISLTSTASKARSAQAYRQKLAAQGVPVNPNIPFNEGDMVTTVIKCANGETITLKHSISLPRPYSRNGRVQGTNGIWLEDANGIYIDGISHEEVVDDVAGNPYRNHYWDKVEDYYDEYDHPIWKDYKNNQFGGHGGIDALAILAFVDAVRNQTNTPIDAYDVASWMAVTCLSEQSIAIGSAPIPFPDFTSGKWVYREPEPKSRWALDGIYEECFE